MSTTDDLRAIRDAIENLGTDLAGIAFRLGGVIERGTDRRAVLAEMTRDETADGVRADGFPGAPSSALGDAIRRVRALCPTYGLLDRPAVIVAGETLGSLAAQADTLAAERDRLRDDYDRTAEAADRAASRAAVRLREARGAARVEAARSWEQIAADLTRERDEARADARLAGNLADLAVTERDAARAERDDLAALVARQREDGQRKDAALVRAKAKRRDAVDRAKHWKREAGMADAAAYSAGEQADAAEAAIGRVRAWCDYLASLDEPGDRWTARQVRMALDGPANPTAVVRADGDDPAQGSTAGGNGHESDAGAAEVSASGPGAARAVEGQESVSDEDDRLDLACAWSDYRREYGVSSDLSTMLREHKAFTAGWQAARGTLDLGGVQR